MITIIAVILFTPLVLAGCSVLDHIAYRRRLRRLRTRSVVRPRCVVLPSPDHRGERSPRLAAVPAQRRRPC